MYTIEDIYKDIKENNISIEKIHKMYGGLTIYIPKVPPDFKKKIVEEFTGNNHAVLAHKYNVSKKTVYETIREDRKKKAQQD